MLNNKKYRYIPKFNVFFNDSDTFFIGTGKSKQFGIGIGKIYGIGTFPSLVCLFQWQRHFFLMASAKVVNFGILYFWYRHREKCWYRYIPSNKYVYFNCSGPFFVLTLEKVKNLVSASAHT